MGVPEALVVSSLVGAGASAVSASKQRRVSREAQASADRRANVQRKAAQQKADNERVRNRTQSQIAKNQKQDIQNVGLRDKGIAPLGRELSAAILNDASQTGF